MEQLKGLYQDYLERVAQLQRKRKPLEGVLGFRGGPADDPCHRQFAQDVEQALAQMGEEQCREAVEYVLRMPLQYKSDPLVYWTFMAVQGAVLPYLHCLGSQQAGELRRWFERTYPRWERMPCQEQVLSALKKIR